MIFFDLGLLLLQFFLDLCFLSFEELQSIHQLSQFFLLLLFDVFYFFLEQSCRVVHNLFRLAINFLRLLKFLFELILYLFYLILLFGLQLF